MNELFYGPDEFIFNQDESDNRIFIIVKGQIELNIKK